jgi:hypothetical protein
MSAAIREPARDGRQLTFLNRHTKGIASLRRGQFEYMMVRRINGTDDQGPWPLNETTPLSLTVGLLVGATATVEPKRLNMAHALNNAPLVVYSADRLGRPTGSPFGELPSGVAAISLFLRQQETAEVNVDGSVHAVIRLQNVGTEATSTAVNLSQVVQPTQFRLRACTEMTLTLQQTRATSVRAHWRADPSGADEVSTTDAVLEVAEAIDCDRITIAMLDIRTFLLEFESAPMKNWS